MSAAHLRHFAPAVPADGTPCVYALLLKGRPVYIGSSRHAATRIGCHRTIGRKFDSSVFLPTETLDEALRVEHRLISRHRPCLNRRLLSPQSRKGKRAPGMTLLSVPIHRSLRRRIEAIARRNNKQSATWVREKLTALVARIEAGERGVKVKKGRVA